MAELAAVTEEALEEDTMVVELATVTEEALKRRMQRRLGW